MSKNIKKIIWFILFFGIVLKCIAQENNAQKSLNSVLEILQEKYDVQFNYASTLIDNINVQSIDSTKPLDEIIFDISEQTNLNFVYISKKIITIKKIKKNLCGFIIDKDTGEALPYVTIQNANISTLTNGDGYFNIEIQTDVDVIIIKHFGHKTLERQIRYFNKNNCANIYLIPNHEQLAEIIVYDYLIRGVDKLDNGSFQIDFDKFSILPGLIENDVLQTVKALPGIQSIDETVSNINIRGGSNDQNLITWDGIKMYQSGHFFGLISMYNSNITQKVEIRKNGTSAKETDGVSGTISMHTDPSLNSNFKASISANLLDVNGFIDTPIGEKASLQITARKSISDLVQTPTYSQYFERISQDTEIYNNTSEATNSDIMFDFYDTSIRLLVQPSDREHFKFNFIYTANEVVFNEKDEVSGLQEIRQSKLNQSSIAGGVQYHKKWTDNFNTQLHIYETDYKLRGKNVNIQENQRFLQENMVSETGIKLITNTSLSPQISIINGYNFVETKVSNLDDVDDPKYILLEAKVLRTHAIFSEIEISSLNKKNHYNLGVRYNYLNKFNKHVWEPRLSFNHKFSKKIAFEVLGEFKHQSTSQIINFQNDFLGIEKRRWQLSDNESVPIIQSKQLSFGLSYNHKGWLFNLTPFYKKVTGITTQSQGFQDAYEYTNENGDYEASGADLLLRKQFKKGSSWISYSYLNSNYYFKELEDNSFSSNFDITNAIVAGTNYTFNKLLLALGINWHTGKPYTEPDTNTPVSEGTINYGPTNENRQHDYLRVDFSSRYDFNLNDKTKLEIGFALWNVLNKKNIISSYYTLDDSENTQKINEKALSITPNIHLKLTF
ncbi:TonB-dependent receptor [Cellulophaga baltica]|uniref:TonB-dependent receptor n=1 Tax=Cellulophaga TaxID=104264 RepID=UPI001C07136A|nr:carboxypeptidase-like regulatory domain-containing protein [Cellulophaga sp. 1_MG-2023]MBU2995777.1 TonB-dependent receptor [Cellulophaga baltica]MDO6767171.1 carboxypeptidase-like regulatory domain-containing protein [Cellulophaga sp. 1_MG-2023]